MIKLIIEINEVKNRNFSNIKATRCDVDIKEICTNVTSSENEVSDILKERIGVENKVQLVNRSKNKKDVEELLKELFSI